ncbi:MAG: hypothetical protein RLZZ598_2000 [Pseudomonadota bacterium]
MASESMRSSEINGQSTRSGPRPVASPPRAGRGNYDPAMSTKPNPELDLTPLQTRVVREIVAYARRENLAAGAHLVESVLAEQIGTSRSPVNVALRHLVDLGMLSHDLNRGYFLSRDALAFGDVAQQLSAVPDDPLYLRIAEDRLAHGLPDMVTESDLMRRYQVGRSTLRKALSRIQQEGWVEKSVGHGWEFQPMIDSPQAYEESYVFRAAIEPTGLLSPSFTIVDEELGALRRQQEFIAGNGWKTMTPIELFEANSQFHETLAKWSGNRFILQSVRRTDQLRRLVEYRQARERSPRQTQAQEHLQILDAIAAGDALKAASLMRAHLDGARRGKVHGRDVFGRGGT